jgi:hypothetical protein
MAKFIIGVIVGLGASASAYGAVADGFGAVPSWTGDRGCALPMQLDPTGYIDLGHDVAPADAWSFLGLMAQYWNS